MATNMKLKLHSHLLQSSLLITLFVFCSSALSIDIKPYEIQYQSTVRGFNIKTVRKLENKDNQFELKQTISAMMMSTEEVSTFKISNNNIIPLSYIYDRDIFGHSTTRINLFQYDLKTATYQDEDSPARGIKLEGDVYDPINAIIPIRLQLMEKNGHNQVSSIQVLEKKRIRELTYNILGTEWLETPLGYMETLKVERLRNKKEKHTTIWLAKDWDYVVVKISHMEPDEQVYHMNIVKGTIGDKTITGRDSLK